MLTLRYWLIQTKNVDKTRTVLALILSAAGLVGIPLIVPNSHGERLHLTQFQMTLYILTIAGALLLLATINILSRRWRRQAIHDTKTLTNLVLRRHGYATNKDSTTVTQLGGDPAHPVRKEIEAWGWTIPMPLQRKKMLISAGIHSSQAFTPQTRALNDEDLLIMAALLPKIRKENACRSA